MICKLIRISNKNPYNMTLKLFQNIVIINEYKFVVDFKGLMHFDDQDVSSGKNVIRDVKFVNKFYQTLRKNQSEINNNYPYYAQFWGQKNYLRCAIEPIIYNTLKDGNLEFSIGMKVPFEPQKLYLDLKGQLCYPYDSQFIKIKGIFSNTLLSHFLENIKHNQTQTIIHYQQKEFLIPHLND